MQVRQRAVHAAVLAVHQAQSTARHQRIAVLDVRSLFDTVRKCQCNVAQYNIPHVQHRMTMIDREYRIRLAVHELPLLLVHLVLLHHPASK